MTRTAAAGAAAVLAALLRPAGRRRADPIDLLTVFTAASRRGWRRIVGTLRWDPTAQRTDALLAVAAAAIVVEQLTAGRWRRVLDALDAGASGAEIVVAAGVSLDQLAAGLDAHLRSRSDLYPEPKRDALLDRLTGGGS